jgi:hypothetical protein
MANQTKAKNKSSIDARKPNNDKYPKVFFDEWVLISLIL